jgi:hypothetical protein
MAAQCTSRTDCPCHGVPARRPWKHDGVMTPPKTCDRPRNTVSLSHKWAPACKRDRWTCVCARVRCGDTSTFSAASTQERSRQQVRRCCRHDCCTALHTLACRAGAVRVPARGVPAHTRAERRSRAQSLKKHTRPLPAVLVPCAALARHTPPHTPRATGTRHLANHTHTHHHHSPRCGPRVSLPCWARSPCWRRRACAPTTLKQSSRSSAPTAGV